MADVVCDRCVSHGVGPCVVLAAKKDAMRRQRLRHTEDSKFRCEESEVFSRQDALIQRVKALAVVGGSLWQ